MNLLCVMYTLTVGTEKFLKQIFVQIVPPVGSHLKIANHSFIVREFEQDLDAYTDEHYKIGASCESVRATLNTGCYKKSEYPKIVKDLLKNSWRPAKEYKG